MAEIKSTIGTQIRKQRKLKGKTQEELGKSIGKTRHYIMGVESNLSIPRPFDLANIEKELNFKVQL